MKGCPKCGRHFTQTEEFCPDDGETLADLGSEANDPLVGTILDGRYVIGQKLGEGGMGIVYLASHAVIAKRCAVKVLRPSADAEGDMAERFIQEARSTAAINNPHVIEITDFGQTKDGSAYFVMEFLDGRSLQSALKEEGRFEIPRAFHVAEQCCEALAAAHKAGVVHRDLKPENLILIHRDKDPDYLKVLDFGIAKVARATGRLTRTGTIFGTPQYMAPEQAAGTAVDLRVDIYSLGIILYEMLCGRVPFEADTFMGVLTKHLYEQPLPPSRVLEQGLPRSAESIILKSLSKKPDRRYQSMEEMQADLRAMLEGRIPEAEKEEIAKSTIPPPPSDVVGFSTRRRKSERSDRSETKGIRPVFLGIGVALIAAAVGVGWWMTLGSNAPQGISEGTTVKPPDRASVMKAGLANESVGIKNEIIIHSKPEGARVYLNDALVGTTPVSVPRPPLGQGNVTYRLKREGYQDLDALITAAAPESFTPEMMPLPIAPALKSAAESNVEPAPHEHESSRTKAEKSQKSSSKKRKKNSGLGSDIVDPWGDK